MSTEIRAMAWQVCGELHSAFARHLYQVRNYRSAAHWQARAADAYLRARLLLEVGP